MSGQLRVLVIEPGHGSVWLEDAHYEGGSVVGTAWDNGQRGSALMPDDYIGEEITLTFPRSLILREERSA
jgi:hypothetical protein